jgi:hypothetical protein
MFRRMPAANAAVNIWFLNAQADAAVRQNGPSVGDAGAANLGGFPPARGATEDGGAKSTLKGCDRSSPSGANSIQKSRRRSREPV